MTCFAAALALAFGVVSSPHVAMALQDPQPGWDDDEAEAPPSEEWVETAPVDEEPPAAAVPPAPVIDAPPGPLQRPSVSKGTGLIIGASVTGGLAWVVGLTRMAFVSRCAQEIEQNPDNGAATTCFFQAGVANLVMAPVQWTLNYATWGLAPAAGAIRGRHDGVAYAFDGEPERSTGGFIGAGAALLGVGVIGRIVMFPMFYRALDGCVDGEVSSCATNLRLQMFGVQMSAAAIGAGAGLLAYGIAYNSASRKYGRLLEEHGVRLAPQIGWAYTGMAVSGRF